MSDLLIVAPTNWTDLVADWVGTAFNVQEVQYWLEQKSWADLEGILGPREEIPAGKQISDARLIYMDDGYHLWVLFV